MEKIKIWRNGKRLLAPNFEEHEFYLGRVTRAAIPSRPDFHLLDPRLIDAVQIIRDFYGVPVYVNSTYRPHYTTGYHPRSQALDFQFGADHSDYLSDFHYQIVSRGELYLKLFDVGIRGFGLYDNFAHIDTRSSLTFWNNALWRKPVANSSLDPRIGFTGNIPFNQLLEDYFNDFQPVWGMVLVCAVWVLYRLF